MRTQQGWTNGDGSGGRRSGLATCAVILSSARGLGLPAQPAGAQTLDGSVGAVQPNAVGGATPSGTADPTTTRSLTRRPSSPFARDRRLRCAVA